MAKKELECPDCAAGTNLDRREFLRTVGVTAAAAGSLPLWSTPSAQAAPKPTSAAETAVKALYDTLTEAQKKEVCFAWDYQHPVRGLLRTYVSNNWHITKPAIKSDFYTKQQQTIILDIFKGIINPDWHARIGKQLKDDTGGKEWGADQNIAIFGKPGSDKFEFVMTGRHITIRADGNCQDHVAFGGPIFYGHAASGFNEKVHHPGNVFWHQAEAANKVFTMLDGKQQTRALVKKRPDEWKVPFPGAKGSSLGIPVADLSADQKKELHKVLLLMIEPYRKEDQDEALECFKKQGGLEKCNLAFYEEGDLGNDREWDNWRIEGPAFVWYFRGTPHLHVWVNLADDPCVELNSGSLGGRG